MNMSPTIPEQIDAVVREDGGRLLATLIYRFRDFQLAEDCLQDALAQALEHWQACNVPNSPRAWLLQVAHRKAIDKLRRRANFQSKQVEYAQWAEQPTASLSEEDGFPDERLRLIFTCCHPALEEETRIALTLRTLGGLTTKEIARAFLVGEEAMAQRMVRARKKIAKAGIAYEVPEPQSWPQRFESVLNVIYLIFNEGYASRAEPYIRDDLMREAIRLARMVLVLLPAQADAEGLLALMLLHHARLPARLNPGAGTVPLDEQDRSIWNRDEIAEGLRLVELALSRKAVGAFQIQASISALHAEAASYDQTDWAQIVLLYEALLRFRQNPVIELNRIAAVSFCGGPEHALEQLAVLQNRFEFYQPFHALKADLLRRTKSHLAQGAYDLAISLTNNLQERIFLERRRQSCCNGANL